MVDKLKSRKLWISVIGCLFAALSTRIGIDLQHQAQTALEASPALYVLVQGLIDLADKLTAPAPAPAAPAPDAGRDT